MSVFEPQVVISLLRSSSLVTPKDRETFRTKWTNSVNRRADAWNNLPESRKSPRPRCQLEWESQVVEYVSFVWEKTRPRKKGNAPTKLSIDVPLLGPRFIPPSYLHLRKRTGTFDVNQETQFLKPVNIVHPFYYPELACCPQCQSTDVTWEGWTGTGARELHGVIQDEVALGLQLRCNTCRSKRFGVGSSNSSEMLAKQVERSTTGSDTPSSEPQVNGSQSPLNYCCATTSSVFWKSWEHWNIPRGIPIFLHRCGLTRDLFDLIIELRPSSTSGGLAEQIKQLHLLEYHRRAFEYFSRLDETLTGPRTVASFFGTSTKGLQTFSAFTDPLRYDAQCISDDTITEVYLEFITRAREHESKSYMQTLTAICGSLDSTFKISNKATVTDKDGQRSKYLKGGVLSVLNEKNEIIAWSKANAKIQELLTGIRRRTQLLGQPLPEMFVSDNCCLVRSAITAVFPDSDSIQDVWHFIARYMATVLNGSKNPHRAAVMSDVTNAILKRHASEGEQGAEYWDQEEQEQRLVHAYDKWAARGTIWSVASEKVHQEQLKHIRKGCLQRRRQDILSDGSRIEGCHKAWNTLQRAQPSGIMMLAALSHDFVHRRNVRIASNRPEKTPFITLTAGSHHTNLTNAIAKLYNRLCAADAWCTLLALPELQLANSGETFGLVPSEHISTFGGLVKEEVNEFQVDITLSQADRDASRSNTITERAILSSRDFIFHELNIDPKLLELPQVSARSQSTSQPCPASSAPSNNLNTSPSSPMDAVLTSTKQKVEETMPLRARDSAVDAVTRPEHRVGTLEQYFRHSSYPRPLKSRRVEASGPTPAPSIAFTPSQPLLSTSPINTFTTESPTAPSMDASLPLIQDTPGVQGCIGRKTRSQHLFAAATGINPESLTIQGNVEFFLFMEMRVEFSWVSYEMTSKRWADAADEYNRRLVEKLGMAAIRKNPLALLRKLGEMEVRLIERVQRDDFKSKRNTEAFWRHHCFVINLVKANAATGKKPRKVPTCSRCKTIMYPGPEKSTTNHKRGICADGVRSRPAPETPELPHWPQPHGVFSDGTTFHTQAFLKMVQETYEIVVSGSVTGHGMMLVEAQAFLLMLAARLIVPTDMNGHPTVTLFKLYPGFKVDGSVSSDRIIQHEGVDCLRISYLEHEA